MKKYFIGSFLDRDQSDEHAAITSDIADAFGIPPSHIVPPHVTFVAPFIWEGDNIELVQKTVHEHIGTFPFAVLQRTGLITYHTKEGQSLAWGYAANAAAKELIATVRNTVRRFGATIANSDEAVLRNLRSRLVHNIQNESLFEKVRVYTEKAYRLPSSSFRVCNIVFFLQENGQWTTPKGSKLVF